MGHSKKDTQNTVSFYNFLSPKSHFSIEVFICIYYIIKKHVIFVFLFKIQSDITFIVRNHLNNIVPIMYLEQLIVN